jgi:hypothetical protein
MFALVSGQQLILGPIPFNYRLINSALEEDLELSYRVNSSDYLNVPIQVTDQVKILPTVDNIPSFDSNTQAIRFDHHEITDTQVIFYYVVIEKTLDDVKQEVKSVVPQERWRKENTIITVTINNTNIEVSTSRENRLALMSKLIGCYNGNDNGPCNFKFENDMWVSVAKQDLINIISQIDTAVQSAFDWELEKMKEIDACQSIQDVYGVQIRTPQQREFVGISTSAAAAYT